MTEQVDFLQSLTPVAHNPGDPIEVMFRRFHEANPHVYDTLREMALRLKRAGRSRYSIKGLFEVLRWSHAQTTGDEFKLNNNYHALYARELMNREPLLAEFFELRERKHAHN